ncbi:MAG TPA: hypothetical protein PK095_02545 [Myxococcota bacterium]|nr:hypothetical protein [Myxococcota bacterium]
MKIAPTASALVLMFSVAACLDSRSGSLESDTHTADTRPDTTSPEVDTGSEDDTGFEDDTTPDTTATQDTGDTSPSLDTTPIVFSIVSSAESDTVVPQTRVYLSSQGLPDGAVAYRWSAIQPEGSVSTFQPSAFVANPTFELNVAGVYTFILEVLDGDGQVLGTARYTMSAVPVSDLHISLTWQTPNDPDETNTGNDAGSDLDLHLLRTDLGATWFDPAHDIFWDSPGGAAPDGSPRPSLDRDDTDGGGPENINFTSSGGGTYAVGVHYWASHGYGSSFATVRIYVRGQLVEEWANVELEDRELWHSHHIDMTGADIVVTRVGGGNPVIEVYNPPDYFQP